MKSRINRSWQISLQEKPSDLNIFKSLLIFLISAILASKLIQLRNSAHFMNKSSVRLSLTSSTLPISRSTALISSPFSTLSSRPLSSTSHLRTTTSPSTVTQKQLIFRCLWTVLTFIVYNITQSMNLQEKEILKGAPLLEESTQDFILRSRDSEKGAIPSVIVRFGASVEQSLNGCPSKICFNSDRKCYTPTFLDHANKAISQANDAHLRQIFERKIVESSNSQPKILQPKPSTDFCSICKESFPDYSKHIAHPVHRKKIAASKTEAYIYDLCGQVNRPVRRCSSASEDEESLTMSTRKRIKMENSLPVSTSNIISTSTI